MEKKNINSLADLKKRKRQIRRDLRLCEMNIQENIDAMKHPFQSIKNFSSSYNIVPGLSKVAMNKDSLFKVVKGVSYAITFANIGLLVYRKIKEHKDRNRK